jgi:acetyltransferase
MVGLGGIYVEIFRDTAARLAPVSAPEALAMLDELKVAPLLRGTRGEPAVDRHALAGFIGRFSQLLMDLPELEEIEINPLMVGPDGAVAVDARARLDR